MVTVVEPRVDELQFGRPNTIFHDTMDILRIFSRICFARGYVILFIAVLVLGAWLGV